MIPFKSMASCTLNTFHLTVLQEFRHSHDPEAANFPYHANNCEPLKNRLATLLHQFDVDVKAFSSRLAVVEAQAKRGHLSCGEEGISNIVKEMGRTWSDIQQGREDVLKAETLLKQELREDEWLIVLRS